MKIGKYFGAVVTLSAMRTVNGKHTGKRGKARSGQAKKHQQEQQATKALAELLRSML